MSFLQGQSVVQRICVLKKHLIYRDFQERFENRFPLQRVQKKKLTFKERKEFEALEVEIPLLEAEKAELETAMSSGTLSNDELLAKSERIAKVIEEIDEKTMRWLELSELA